MQQNPMNSRWCRLHSRCRQVAEPNTAPLWENLVQN